MVNKQFATAVHIMVALALETSEDKPLSSSRLAASVNTNPVVIRRLLLLLQKANLVNSTKGKNGGVSLSKNPSEITLEAIYDAVTTCHMISTSHRKIKKSCPVSRTMKDLMYNISSGVENASKEYLRSILVSDLKMKVKQ